jgi:hypothetical protein
VFWHYAGFRRSPAAGFAHQCMLLLSAAAVHCGSPRWRCRCSSPMGCVDYHDSTLRRGLARDALGRPSLACLTTSGGEWVERKMDAPLSLNVLDGDRGRPPPNRFPLFAVFARLPSDMRLAEPPQLTRPDGLVVCRHGFLDDTPPPPCERLEHGAAPFLSPMTVACSWRIRRPVACRCGAGVSSLLRGTVPRRFGWTGAGKRAQTNGKSQKTGGRTACQACLAACSPRHLSFPSFPPLLGNPCLHL